MEWKSLRINTWDRMKEAWQKKKIKDLTTVFADGDWIESKDQSSSGIRLIQTGNIGNGFYISKDDKPHYISEETFDKLSCFEILEGDCLISRLPHPIGRACILPKLSFRAITAVDCSILRFKKIYLPEFFVYYTLSNKYQDEVLKNSTGTTRKRISRKNLENLVIPVPSIQEQLSIVSELDALSSIISKHIQLSEEYNRLEQAIFHDMFGDLVTNEKGWNKEVFANVSESMTKGPFGSDIKKSLYVPKADDTYKVYIQVNAISKDVTLGDYYISKEYYDSKMKRFAVNPGDYIITCDGTLGKFVRLPENIEKGIISASLLRLTLNNKIESKYFEFLWETYMMPILTGQVRNAALKHLPSASNIGKLEIPLPPLSLQTLFAEKIRQIESLKAKNTQAQKEAELLFAERMNFYFGE